MKRLLLGFLIATSAFAADAITSSDGPRAKISVDYPDMDVREILRKIGDAFELNLIISDSLNGRTSLKLRDVTWEEAFKVILEPIDWKYEKDGDVIVIKKKNPSPIGKESEFTEQMMSLVSEMQFSAAKSVFRDKDYAEALAEFYWNLYTALVAKGFTKKEAMNIVTTTSADGSLNEK